MGSSKKRTRVVVGSSKNQTRVVFGSSKKQTRVVVGSIEGCGAEKTCCGRLINNNNNNNNVVCDDLLVEILVNLPVQSLSRFKSVCKSWYSLIGSPDFVHRHATMEDKSNTFIFQYRYQSIFPFYYRNKIDIYSPHFCLLSGDQFEVFKDLGVRPLQNKPRRDKRARMVSSCHGIICLHDKLGDVYLWNPATKHFRRLPKPLAVPDGLYGDDRVDFAAFGFDVKAKDYKVLKITSFLHGDGHSYFSRVQVYSLNTDSWRFIDDSNIRAFANERTRYMNGKYYFFGRKIGVGRMILSFDFGEETFRTIRILEPLCILEFIGEKVGYIKRMPQHKREVWEFNECWGKESSTKRYILGRGEKLVAISKDGEIGITSDIIDGLKMCNLVTRELKNLQSPKSTRLASSAQVYKESLVSVERNDLLQGNNN